MSEKEQVAAMLRAADVRWVRVLWCDNANIIRAKSFNVSQLDSRYIDGVGIAEAQMALPVMYDAVVPDSGLTPVGEVRLRPDWNTLNVLPYAPGQAQVMGDMVTAGATWPVCPREFLRRQIARAAEHGLEIVAAFENEFFLLEAGGDGITPVDETPFASTLAMGQSGAVINDMVDALEAQGVIVEQYHPEAGPGQHELATRYCDAMAAADRQIIFRETVRGVALGHGLRASFLPKPFEHAAGSGCHLHLSLWRDGKSFTTDPQQPYGLTAEAMAFMAGVLKHLPALMAITTPSINSYRRIQPHFWSGAFCVWGMDNREAALRVPKSPDGGAPSNMELKAVDASSNPYLALGAVIAAGLDGVVNQLVPGEPVDVDPGTLSDDVRNASGIAPLPGSLSEALVHLEKNAVLLEALGPALAHAFIAVRKAEWGALKNVSFEEETRLLLEKY
ncbi:glutamine synthetase family protein [Billgrantia endophytica]|uniref:Glutamine synthetase n=1 Tax=Billgrantia endophytica TaxID=2033802 RepID=A0A2N7UAF8_9GAMM|nr:glutamine synthetase family protein [Halomonas endophytica]PMR77412.1 glutamine synthetase [Halomonas endophytica]